MTSGRVGDMVLHTTRLGYATPYEPLEANQRRATRGRQSIFLPTRPPLLAQGGDRHAALRARSGLANAVQDCARGQGCDGGQLLRTGDRAASAKERLSLLSGGAAACGRVRAG